MKFTLWPKTLQGKWSASLSIAFIILILMQMVSVVPLPGFGIAAFGLVGFFTGLMAVFKNKERSLLAYLSVPVGLIIIFWTAAELMYPH